MSTATHGRSKTPAYKCWIAIKRRCLKASAKEFQWYGARGIRICERWLRFENFFADMGDPPPGLSIERIDNDGHYEPGNCRWATPREQTSNRRTNRKVMFGGELLTVAEIARRVGTSRQTIRFRLESGWQPDELAMPVNHGNAWKRNRTNGSQPQSHQ